MSYERIYRGTISGTATGTASVGPSQSSQNVSVTVQWSEEVVTTIYVDTDPVDMGIQRVNGELALLEAGIVTGANLQIAKKHQGAALVAEATSKGFNTLIFSEIDQQLKELHSRLESRSALLVSEKNAASARSDQFETDFQRIKGRYVSLFGTLDEELERRIKTIDAPVFQLVDKEYREQIVAALAEKPAGAVLATVESEQIRETLARGWVKRNCQAVIRALGDFLIGQRSLRSRFGEETLDRDSGESAVLSLPVVVLATKDLEGVKTRLVHRFAESGIADPTGDPVSFAEGLTWLEGSPEGLSPVSRALDRLIEDHAKDSATSIREAEYVRRWWNESHPQTLEN